MINNSDYSHRSLIQRTTATGIVVSGFGLSAFLFSMIARTIFPGNTSDFLFTLALGTPVPMVLGWFLIRVCPYPEHLTRTITENDDREESGDPSLAPNEASQLIAKNNYAQSPNITGLALMRSIDFWILFWIVSFCECLPYETKRHSPNKPSIWFWDHV